MKTGCWALAFICATLGFITGLIGLMGCMENKIFLVPQTLSLALFIISIVLLMIGYDAVDETNDIETAFVIKFTKKGRELSNMNVTATEMKQED